MKMKKSVIYLTIIVAGIISMIMLTEASKHTGSASRCRCTIPYLHTNANLTTNCIVSNASNNNLDVTFKVLTSDTVTTGKLPICLEAPLPLTTPVTGEFIRKSTILYTFKGWEILLNGVTSLISTYFTPLGENNRYTGYLEFTSKSGEDLSCANNDPDSQVLVTCFQNNPGLASKRFLAVQCGTVVSKGPFVGKHRYEGKGTEDKRSKK